MKTENNQLSASDQKLFGGLGSELDLSRWDSMSRNERIENVSNSKELTYLEVNSLKEASTLVRQYIKTFNIGSSSWTGGTVLDENLNFVALVSYNGRAWDNFDWRNSQEIEI